MTRILSLLIFILLFTFPYAFPFTLDGRKKFCTTKAEFRIRPRDERRWSARHRLRLASSDSNQDASNKPSVSFSRSIFADKSVESEGGNLVDSTLSFITSDVGSIALGLLGLLVLLANRLLFTLDSDDDTGVNVAMLEQETRSNLLALLACGSVLVNGVSKLNVETVLAERVELRGTSYAAVQFATTESFATESQQRATLEWGLTALLAATPASSALLLRHADDAWEAVAGAGVLPTFGPDPITALRLPAAGAAAAPLHARLLSAADGAAPAETYLPTLQNLPAKAEFTYLPINAQAALLLPAGPSRLLVLGSDRARSFTPRDIAWCQTVADRLAVDLSPR